MIGVVWVYLPGSHTEYGRSSLEALLRIKQVSQSHIENEEPQLKGACFGNEEQQQINGSNFSPSFLPWAYKTWKCPLAWWHPASQATCRRRKKNCITHGYCFNTGLLPPKVTTALQTGQRLSLRPFRRTDVWGQKQEKWVAKWQAYEARGKPLILPASVRAKSFQALQTRCTFIMSFLRRIKVKAAIFSVMLCKHN